MKLLKQHIEHGKSGTSVTAALFETEEGFKVHVDFEIDGILAAHIEVQDNRLLVWKEIIE